MHNEISHLKLIKNGNDRLLCTGLLGSVCSRSLLQKGYASGIACRLSVCRCVVFGIIGGLLCIFTFSPYFVIVGSMLRGISASGTFATLYVFIYRKVNIDRVGRGIGISTASGFLGTLLAPLIGGFLALYLSWIWVYLFTLPFLVIVLVLLIRFDDEWIDDIELDRVGCVIWAIAMILLIYGVTYLSTFVGIIAFILSIVFILAFVVYELKVYQDEEIGSG